MTEQRITDLAERHTPEASHTHEGLNSCSSCGQSWPCEVAFLLDERERLREALRQIVEGDYPADAINAETWAAEVLADSNAVAWAPTEGEER